MKISLPLLDALVQIEEKVEKRFLIEGGHWLEHRWLEAIDLSYLYKSTELQNGGYYCTPTNSMAFAWPGVDGEHFSFLVQNAQIDDESPIIFTAPCHYDGDVNVAVAKNLRTFFRLALQHGCFPLSELAYDAESAIRVLTGHRSCTEESLECEHLEDKHSEDKKKEIQRKEMYQKIRIFVAKELDLPPCAYTKEEFDALQHQYLPLLQIPEEP